MHACPSVFSSSIQFNSIQILYCSLYCWNNTKITSEHLPGIAQPFIHICTPLYTYCIYTIFFLCFCCRSSAEPAASPNSLAASQDMSHKWISSATEIGFVLPFYLLPSISRKGLSISRADRDKDLSRGTFRSSFDSDQKWQLCGIKSCSHGR